jgi:hypothetical protein
MAAVDVDPFDFTENVFVFVFICSVICYWYRYDIIYFILTSLFV